MRWGSTQNFYPPRPQTALSSASAATISAVPERHKAARCRQSFATTPLLAAAARPSGLCVSVCVRAWYPSCLTALRRVCIHASGEDVKHSDLAFQAYGEKKKESTDQAWQNGLPVLTINGKTYTQSLAMLRYFGKKAKLYPTDDIEALAVDEIMDLGQDILTKTPQDPDPETKIKKRQEYAAGKMKSMFALLNQRLEEAGSGWCCGSDLTIADLVIYYILTMLRSGNFDHVDKNYADEWPKIAELEKKLPEHPVLKAYAASKA